MDNDLESLVVDGKEWDRKLVTEILSPFLRLDKDSVTIRPLGSWNDLKAYIKILLYLLARKAMKALDFDLEEEAASPTEVMNDTGLKKGTVNPALRSLLDDRIVEQTKDRRYYIPNHAIERIKAMISQI